MKIGHDIFEVTSHADTMNQGDDMEITERHEQGVTIAVLTGKLDAENAPVFNQWFMDRIVAGQTRFVLDFGGISYLSSAGLRAVLSAWRTLEKQQGGLAICGLYGTARQVFQVAGLLKVFPICPDVAGSLAVLQQA
jgi:anti-anti-sigma factor